MRKFVCMLVALLLIVIATSAQAQDGSDTRPLITPDNAYQLTRLAELPTVEIRAPHVREAIDVVIPRIRPPKADRPCRDRDAFGPRRAIRGKRL